MTEYIVECYECNRPLDKSYIYTYNYFDDAKDCILKKIHGPPIKNTSEKLVDGRKCWYFTTINDTEYIITEFIPKIIILDVKQTKKYQKNESCPFCNSDDTIVNMDEHSRHDGAMECRSCKRSWRESISSLKIEEIY